MEMERFGTEEFEEYVSVIFETDRMGVPKGMVEVLL